MQRASEILFISPQALSKTIINLENEMGVKLFNRDGKKLILNNKGKELLYYADLVVETIQTASQKIRANDKDSIITIESISYAFYFGISNALSEFNKYSMQVYQPNNNGIINNLIEKKADIIIDYFTDTENYDNVISKCEWTEENYFLNVVNSDPLFQKDVLDIEDLNNRTLLVNQSEYFWIEQFKKYYNVNFETNIYEHNTYVNAVKLSELPILITYTQKILAQLFKESNNNRISSDKSIMIKTNGKRKIYLYWLKGNESKLRPTIDFLLN